MASALVVTEFSSWLDKKLQELNTDETVFGSYITGILDSDETADEKCEALQGILAEIVENTNDIGRLSTEILDKWEALKPQQTAVVASSQDLDDKLVKLLESQSLATTKQKHYTEEEKKIREAILSQFGQMTDSEGEDEEGEPGENLEKNVNAQLVAEAVKNKREQSRLDSQRKKEKDKEDREKQKQLKEDKKEKRKTVKGERKR